MYEFVIFTSITSISLLKKLKCKKYCFHLRFYTPKCYILCDIFRASHFPWHFCPPIFSDFCDLGKFTHFEFKYLENMHMWCFQVRFYTPQWYIFLMKVLSSKTINLINDFMPPSFPSYLYHCSKNEHLKTIIFTWFYTPKCNIFSVIFVTFRNVFTVFSSYGHVL